MRQTSRILTALLSVGTFLLVHTICKPCHGMMTITSIVAYSVAYYNYKNPTFTVIPNYIVDRADIEEFDEMSNRDNSVPL